MNLVTINVNTTSNITANATGMVIRENSQFRIVYYPQLVNNSKNPEESISGSLICQKKRKNDKWEDLNGISLKNLKTGEWTKFNIELGEMLNLIRYANKLKEIYDKNKSLPRIKQKHLLILDENLDQKEIEKFNEFARSNPEVITNLKKVLDDDVEYDRLLKKISDNPKFIQDVANSLDDDKSQELYNDLKIKFINPNYLKENLNEANEDFWQTLFKENPNILYSIIPSVFQFICDKPYLGGKAIDNKGGNIGDFLYKCGENNVSIIEIKTPVTKLIGKKYRNNVYSPTEELSGAITQLRRQKDSILKHYLSLKESLNDEKINIKAFDPKTYLIIGNTKEMEKDQLDSFELYRNSFKDIEIITFDEVIEKLELIVANLSSK